jgi:hypothetical protein
LGARRLEAGDLSLQFLFDVGEQQFCIHGL